MCLACEPPKVQRASIIVHYVTRQLEMEWKSELTKYPIYSSLSRFFGNANPIDKSPLLSGGSYLYSTAENLKPVLGSMTATGSLCAFTSENTAKVLARPAPMLRYLSSLTVVICDVLPQSDYFFTSFARRGRTTEGSPKKVGGSLSIVFMIVHVVALC
jgi:hypothetical protein